MIYALIKKEIDDNGRELFTELATSNNKNEIFIKWSNMEDRTGLEMVKYETT